ncbi:MAG: membrane protein [Planctomycetota bacterium]|nr:MAG: membrane protein [Planctomycetota bacterium]
MSRAPSSAVRAGFLIVALAVLLSGWEPWRRDIWLMEASPAAVGMGLMALLWRRFPWTPLTVFWCVAFSLVLCGGAHWSYARVPLGHWVQEQFDLSRNPYDRLGHFLQGVTPALLAREMLLRRTPLRAGRALFWIVCAIALAISALYELIEWWAALLTDPDAGTAFLGHQGDAWDTQWDMALALGGALFVQLLFARLHDRQLQQLTNATN